VINVAILSSLIFITYFFRLLYCAKDPVSVVVLEDVKPDFETQLNLEDLKIVCNKIAQCHASSISLNENNVSTLNLPLAISYTSNWIS
jgi:hypothetical protein